MTTQIQETAQAISEQHEAVLLSSNVEANGLRVGEALPEGLEGTEAEVTNVLYKDMVSMWNRETGAHSYALPYMVPDLAKQRVKSGKYKGSQQFAFRNSDVPAEILNLPKGLKLPCFLNDSHPDHAKYRGQGFAACAADGLSSEIARKTHMKKSHPRAWATIQEDTEQARRDEDRSIALANTAALQAMVAQLVQSQAPVAAPVPVVEAVEPTIGQAAMQAPEPTDAERAAFEESQAEDKPYSAICATCQEEIFGRSQAGAFAALRGHENREHPSTQ